MKLLARIQLVLFSMATLAGCLSPIALNRAVELYDNAAILAESKQLLTNIVRAQHHEPIHFTQVSSIAATFNFSANAGATPAVTEGSGLLAPIFGGSVSENPTFSIDPIASDEFTKRLLTPFSQHKLTLLLRQHFDIDLMLRLMAQEVHIFHAEPQPVVAHVTAPMPSSQQRSPGGLKDRTDPSTGVDERGLRDPSLAHHSLPKAQELYLRNRQRTHVQYTAYHNNPEDRAGYEMFRRIVLHLSAIQDQKQLFAEPLTLTRNWKIPASAISPEGLFQAIEKNFTIVHDEEKNAYYLSKQLPGPILVTNYDPDILCCEEQRAELYDLVNPWIENEVAFDIRPGYPGGEWPIRGAFRLRSFHTILNFLGHSLGEQAEYYVEKDPRTPPIARNENPSHTLDLIVTDQPPTGIHLSVHSHGKYYGVNNTGAHAHWNLNAFQLLYILFRLTVTDSKSLGLPITIAK